MALEKEEERRREELRQEIAIYRMKREAIEDLKATLDLQEKVLFERLRDLAKKT